MDDPNGLTRVAPPPAAPIAPLRQPPTSPADHRLQEVRRAVGDEYDVLGEVCEAGEGKKSGVVYLAQRAASTRLDALRLVEAADYVEVIGTLGHAVQAPTAELCPKCGAQTRAGARFCGNCRADLAEARVGASAGSMSIAEFMKAKDEAARHGFELVGEIDARRFPAVNEQTRGTAFLARASATSRIAVLFLERSDVGSSAILSLDQSSLLSKCVGVLFDIPVPAPVVAASPVVASPPPPAASPAPAAPSLPSPVTPATEWPSTRPSRVPAWGGIVGIALAAAAVIAAVVWLVSATSAKNAARDANLAAERSRVDSVLAERRRRDSVRADSIRLAAAAADSVTIRFNAILPAGATIRVDDAPVSRRLLRLASGSHTLSARARGFKPATETVDLKPGETLVWPPRFEAEPKAVDTTTRRVASACADAAQRSDWARALGVCAKEAGSAKGDAFAERTLGMMHERGLGVAQNLPFAAEWYSASAAHGDRVAQYQYGLMLQNGRGVNRDEGAAYRMFETSANQGETGAQFAVGDALDRGRGVRRNRSEAAKWYQKAAEHGHADAQVALGILLANGDGVPKSEGEATKWFQKAAAQGNERAKQELSRRGIRP